MKLPSGGSSNFEDRTARSLMEEGLHPEDQFTHEELSLMKKNRWTTEDILLLRQFKAGALNIGTRGPDRLDLQNAPTHPSP